MMKNRALRKILGVVISISMLLCLAPSVVAVEAVEVAENALTEISEQISAQAEVYNSSSITMTQPSQDDEGYYLIGTVGELYWFADHVNSWKFINGRLIADITINENVLTEEGELNGDGSNFIEWEPIGYGQQLQEEIWSYEGVFLGDGYTISGLYVNQPGYTSSLFAGLSNNGLISGVNVTDSYVYGDGWVGGIVAYLESGTVENCSFDGLIAGTDEECGGIVGSSGGTIKNCVNFGTVRVNAIFVGGIVGYSSGIVENCYNYGTVIGGSSYVGSIAGISEGNYDYVSNCYYLENTAYLNDGTVVLGVGVTSGKTPADTEGVTESKTAEQFASGEVTYLLNEGVTDGTQVWYQTLETDLYPVFKGETVYNTYIYSDCSKKEIISEYSNSDIETVPDHIFSASMCTVCGIYVQPEKDNEDYYLISNMGELYWFAEYVNSGNSAVNAKLTANIVVNENLLESITYDDEGNITNADSFKAWTPIGNTNEICFSGVFDGQGYTISGLFTYNYDTSYLGLFGYVSGGTITNVNIGDNFIHSSASNVGAICGYATNSTLKFCSNSGTITGASYIAGICGNPSDSSVISNCCNTGDITGDSLATGGVVGAIGTSSIVTACFNSGSVNGKSNSGGIVGILMSGTLENCYNTGMVVCNNQYAGSICGRATGSYTFVNCYYLENTASISDGTAMLGVGVDSVSTPADSEGVTESKTAEEFASGEVAYLLNEGVTDGTQAWYQTLDTDAYPVFEGETVYFNSIYTDCTKSELVSTEYSNREGDTAPHITCDEDGFCIVCGGYKQPETDEEGYYLIGTAGELYWFAEYVNAGNASVNLRLTADIVINENLIESLEFDENGNVTNGDDFREWTPIGYKNSESQVAFSGGFDGGKHIISGLYFNDSTADYVGLFGYTSSDIEYVSVTDSYICGNDYVGGLAGYSSGSWYNWGSYYYFDGQVKGNMYVGGAAGRIDILYGFHNKGQVTGTSYVGGVVGQGGSVSSCVNSGTVSGTQGVTSTRIGGVAGYVRSECEELSNSGDVTGTNYVGGVVGQIYETIVNGCNNSGTITSNSADLGYGYSTEIGGIIGDISYYRGSITLCYNTGDVSGGTTSGGICAYVGSTKIQKCYNTGSIYGSKYAGGIIGSNAGYDITDTYNTGEITTDADGYCGGIVGYTNKALLNCYSTVKLLGDSTYQYETAQVMTEEEFESGKVAYFLNEGATDGQKIWCQNIDLIGEAPSLSPTFSGGTVYYVEKCKNISEPTYSNYIHDGLCYTCGYDVPTLDNDNYYLISNASELYWFAKYVNETDLTANARLVNNIVVNPEIKYKSKELITDVTDFLRWEKPIGNYSDDDTSKQYAGTFDGDGYTITGLYNKGFKYFYKGLFGRIAEKGVVKNVSLVGSFFDDGRYIGGIAGWNDGLIENCSFVDSNIDTDNDDGKYAGAYAGGITGYNTGTINNCCTTVDNTSKNYIIGGYLWGDYVGGIAGYSTGPINSCYSTAEIVGDHRVGAICGSSDGTCVDNSTNNFYITGTVEGRRSDGELAFGKYSQSSYPDEGRATAYESIEAMTTGEMAYLLQSANTEQTWGQRSNVYDSRYNFNRCLPVIDITGVYKVAKVGETGNYSVANIGDTNDDGMVDVEDYQALVNKALSDDHEQIETASYDDIIRYDLDGDGYLDVIDAALMHLFINGFTTVDVYAVGDYDLNGIAFKEADIKAIKHAIENPEKLATYKKYASDINGDGKLDENDLTALTSKYGEVTGAECADNVKVYYRWGNNYSTCTATAMCTLCGKKVATETVNSVQNADGSYTATFTNTLLGTKTYSSK